MSTVGRLVREVFPSGTPTYDEVIARAIVERPERARHKAAPASPFDLFAVSALLLQRSGAYHHVRCLEEGVRAPRRSLPVWKSERELRQAIGAGWKARRETPPQVERLWRQLMAASDEPLFVELEELDAEGGAVETPDWWHTALELMVIADEAARDVGFRDSNSWVALLGESLITQAQAAGRSLNTLSLADPDVVCVLPKSRTPSVGCTLRSLSHNLALLPPRGLARAQWTRWDNLGDIKSGSAGPDSPPLNLLLVPYPYSVSSRQVRSTGIGSGEGGGWGWFDVSPLSEPSAEPDTEALVSHLKLMLDAGRREVGAVHGVIFPELALSRSAYNAIVELLKAASDVEFLVAGVREGEGIRGNFAALTGFVRSGEAEPLVYESIQQKHHRWRLERAQITNYALGASLDPARLWWEDLHITSRTLTVATLRRSTTMAALICEDLARVDPAQEVLRALGPNLVIALLMDGPQHRDRWSARYATVLAEDPGSSVLSFTSLALIERGNQTGFFDESRAIGLWRDDTGERVLKAPKGSPGLLITISTHATNETTLDGREDGNNSLSLRLSGVTPLKPQEGALPDWCA